MFTPLCGFKSFFFSLFPLSKGTQHYSHYNTCTFFGTHEQVVKGKVGVWHDYTSCLSGVSPNISHHKDIVVKNRLGTGEAGGSHAMRLTGRYQKYRLVDNVCSFYLKQQAGCACGFFCVKCATFFFFFFLRPEKQPGSTTSYRQHDNKPGATLPSQQT